MRRLERSESGSSYTTSPAWARPRRLQGTLRPTPVAGAAIQPAGPQQEATELDALQQQIQSLQQKVEELQKESEARKALQIPIIGGGAALGGVRAPAGDGKEDRREGEEAFQHGGRHRWTVDAAIARRRSLRDGRRLF